MHYTFGPYLATGGFTLTDSIRPATCGCGNDYNSRCRSVYGVWHCLIRRVLVPFQTPKWNRLVHCVLHPCPDRLQIGNSLSRTLSSLCESPRDSKRTRVVGLSTTEPLVALLPRESIPLSPSSSPPPLLLPLWGRRNARQAPSANISSSPQAETAESTLASSGLAGCSYREWSLSFVE